MAAGSIRRWALILAPALVIVAIRGAAATAPPTDKTIIVGVLDADGLPVTDLTMAEVRLREDGVDREIVSVKPSRQSLQVAILADTTQSAEPLIRDVRASVAGFVQQIHKSSPETLISIIEFGQAAVSVVPFVSDEAALQSGINKLVGRPGAASVLVEAIVDASNRLAKLPSPRRAIVSLNIEPSNEQSREEPKKVNEAPAQVRGATVVGVAAEGRPAQPRARRGAERGHQEHRRHPGLHQLPVRARRGAAPLRRCADGAIRGDLQAPGLVGPSRPGRHPAAGSDTACQRLRA